MPPAERPTIKKIRAEIERLGITEESAGCSIDELIRQAREAEDPLAFVALSASPGTSRPETPSNATEEKGPSADQAAETERMENEGGMAAPEETPPEPFDAPALPAEASEDLRRFELRRIDVPVAGIPVDQVREGKYHISRHLEVNQLSLEQGIALRSITLGLDAQGAELKNKKWVTKPADAIRWLLERLA